MLWNWTQSKMKVMKVRLVWFITQNIIITQIMIRFWEILQKNRYAILRTRSPIPILRSWNQILLKPLKELFVSITALTWLKNRSKSRKFHRFLRRYGLKVVINSNEVRVLNLILGHFPEHVFPNDKIPEYQFPERLICRMYFNPNVKIPECHHPEY